MNVLKFDSLFIKLFSSVLNNLGFDIISLQYVLHMKHNTLPSAIQPVLSCWLSPYTVSVLWKLLIWDSIGSFLRKYNVECSFIYLTHTVQDQTHLITCCIMYKSEGIFSNRLGGVKASQNQVVLNPKDPMDWEKNKWWLIDQGLIRSSQRYLIEQMSRTNIGFWSQLQIWTWKNLIYSLPHLQWFSLEPPSSPSK